LGRGPFQPTVDALGGRILDLPGYGEEPLVLDFDTATANLAETLPQSAILCGWSLGAMIALATAAKAPEKVAKLILVGSTASFVQREGWPLAMPPTVLAEFAAAVAADGKAALPRFVANFNRGDARAKAVSRELLERANPLAPAATLATGLDWLRDADLRSVAATVRTPTLLIHGAHDPLMPLPAAEALAALLPNARMEVFANCAHAPFISDPAGFQARFAAFIHDPAA
jgi:pimeloyl-[acyl-carrier protein] methyl ester esterase